MEMGNESSVYFPPIIKNTIRLNVELKSPKTDNYYNVVNYKNIIENIVGKENIEMYGLEKSNSSNSFKQSDDYLEDTYIDNSEVLRDTYPHGVKPEIDGFFINKGKLKLKCDSEKSVDNKKVEKLLIKRENVNKLKKSKQSRKREWKVLKTAGSVNVPCQSKLKKKDKTVNKSFRKVVLQPSTSVLSKPVISPYFMHHRLSPVAVIPKLRLNF
ncbi:uncharacterized protein [Parasteatoda tepidariorum]|uniref:uncharacterized protein n=1 Tax=Parasteatoda tepidariorum TaxID=114398 RepID=UPI00077F9FC3|nr:uncharacterized protein LOC107445598 [Parasteatoda tepidariorum]